MAFVCLVFEFSVGIGVLSHRTESDLLLFLFDSNDFCFHCLLLGFGQSTSSTFSLSIFIQNWKSMSHTHLINIIKRRLIRPCTSLHRQGFKYPCPGADANPPHQKEVNMNFTLLLFVFLNICKISISNHSGVARRRKVGGHNFFPEK